MCLSAWSSNKSTNLFSWSYLNVSQIQPTIREEEPIQADILRNKAQRNPSKKKYRAPAPPSRPLSHMGPISEERQPLFASTPNLAVNVTPTTAAAVKSRRQPLDPYHSRSAHMCMQPHRLILP